MSWAHIWGKNILGKGKKKKMSAKGPGRYRGTEFTSISICLRLVHLSSPLGFGAEGGFLIVIRRLFRASTTFCRFTMLRSLIDAVLALFHLIFTKTEAMGVTCPVCVSRE